jgi:hypothetical protein
MLADVLVHIGYSLMLCALLARDILWLRGLLVAAQGILCVYAATHAVPWIAFWNAVFVVINSVWVVRILRERRAVELPPDLRAWHERCFAALPAPAFLRFWNDGQELRRQDVRLVHANERPDSLYFLLEGEVRIRDGERELARLQAGHFVGEMSLLTGGVATADAWAEGIVRLRAWPSPQLQALRARQPVLWTQIQSVLGHDLVEKIRAAPQSAAGAGSAAASAGGASTDGAAAGSAASVPASG